MVLASFLVGATFYNRRKSFWDKRNSHVSRIGVEIMSLTAALLLNRVRVSLRLGSGLKSLGLSESIDDIATVQCMHIYILYIAVKSVLIG